MWCMPVRPAWFRPDAKPYSRRLLPTIPSVSSPAHHSQGGFRHSNYCLNSGPTCLTIICLTIIDTFPPDGKHRHDNQWGKAHFPCLWIMSYNVGSSPNLVLCVAQDADAE